MAGREGGSLRHPAVLPRDVWGRGWMDMLHDGLDPIPPNSRCHGRESEFALLRLHERQAVIRDCPLPDPKGHPAGRTTAREGAVVGELCVSPLKKGRRAKERANVLPWKPQQSSSVSCVPAMSPALGWLALLSQGLTDWGKEHDPTMKSVCGEPWEGTPRLGKAPSQAPCHKATHTRCTG